MSKNINKKLVLNVLLIAASVAAIVSVFAPAALAAGDNLTITANPKFVYVAEPQDVKFTVTETTCIPQNDTVCTLEMGYVQGATVTLNDPTSSSGTTGADGTTVIRVLAPTPKDIIATASWNGSSASTVLKVYARTRLKIVADTTFVNVGVAKVVKFTVTEFCPQGANACTDGSLVNGSTVELTGGGVSGSYLTNPEGQVSVTINANSAGNITATASKEGYATGETTIKAMGQAVFNFTSDTNTVTVGKLQTVTFAVNRECGSKPEDQCRGSPLIPIYNVTITLTGVVSGSSNTSETGKLRFTINATRPGTITATASKEGYDDTTLTLQAVANGTAPTPTPTNPGGGGGGGNSGSSSSSSGSSGSSGGGGGGGGVTTAEPYKNILKSERRDADLQKGKPVAYSFSTPEFSIYQVLITGKENEADVGVRLERLNSTSALVSKVPPGIVYSNENIWAGSKRIESVLIRFKITNAWIADNNLDIKDISLLRFDNGEWKKLGSTIINNSDMNNIYFEARSPGLSSFAVSGIKEEKVPELPDEVVTGDNVAEPVKGADTAGKKSSPGFEAIAVIGIISAAYLLRGRK